MCTSIKNASAPPPYRFFQLSFLTCDIFQMLIETELRVQEIEVTVSMDVVAMLNIPFEMTLKIFSFIL